MRNLTPRKDRIYFISYLDEQKEYYEFYCKIDSIVSDLFYFTITSFVKGNEAGVFIDDVQLAWRQKEFDASYVEEITKDTLKERSRCQICCKELYFVRTALCCKKHGIQGGF